MSARKNRNVALVLGASMIAGLPLAASAALNTSDSSIINLYLLNDQVGSNPFNNSVAGQFKDTAITGSPQDHDDLIAASPTWVSTPGIGTGTGLDFERDNAQYTRFKGWMNSAQGNYSDGKSFSVMIRINPESLADNTFYDVLGQTHGITLEGISTPNEAKVNIALRDHDTFWTLDSYGNTTGTASSGPSFHVTTGQWANVFMIYNANANPTLSTFTVAMDDGTNFYSQVATGAPAGFDPLAPTEGFDNPGVAWFVGSRNDPSRTYDGQVESIVFWDKALSLTEASAIGLTNAAVPEPAAAGVALMGLAALAARRRRHG